MSDFQDKARRIYEEWDAALCQNDVEGLLSLYTPDAVVESPLIPYLLEREEGICRGHADLRLLVETVAKRKPPLRKYHRSAIFTEGNTLMWEYPRQTPQGEQMDFVEVMDLKGALIAYHRVYWGWRGFKVIQEDAYHNKNS